MFTLRNVKYSPIVTETQKCQILPNCYRNSEMSNIAQLLQKLALKYLELTLIVLNYLLNFFLKTSDRIQFAKKGVSAFRLSRTVP